jgi:hypothetical protein
LSCQLRWWHHSLCSHSLAKLWVFSISSRNQAVPMLFSILFESFKYDVPSHVLNFSEAVANYKFLSAFCWNQGTWSGRSFLIFHGHHH